MKTVQLRIAVQVDENAWNAAYGTGTSSKAIVDDVRQYALTHLQESAAAHEGGIVEVTVR